MVLSVWLRCPLAMPSTTNSTVRARSLPGGRTTVTAVAVLRPRGMGRGEKAGGGREGDGRDVGRGRILEGVLPRPTRETMRGRIAVMCVCVCVWSCVELRASLST